MCAPCGPPSYSGSSSACATRSSGTFGDASSSSDESIAPAAALAHHRHRHSRSPSPGLAAVPLLVPSSGRAAAPADRIPGSDDGRRSPAQAQAAAGYANATGSSCGAPPAAAPPPLGTAMAAADAPRAMFNPQDVAMARVLSSVSPTAQLPPPLLLQQLLGFPPEDHQVPPPGGSGGQGSGGGG